MLNWPFRWAKGWMLLVRGVGLIFGQIVWRLSVAATAFFLVRMYWTGLWRTYPALTFFFGVDLLEQVLRLAYPWNSSVIFFAGEAVKIPLVILVLWELTLAGFARHPALARFSRRTSLHVLGICSVAAAINLFLDPALSPDRSPVLHYLYIVERAFTTGILLFVGVLGAFMTWFPVPMRRNVAWFLAGFCFIFAANWVSLLVSNLSPEWAQPVSGVVGDGVGLVVLFCWTIATGREGEEVTTVTGRRWNEAEMVRLSSELDAIHERLVRTNQYN